VSLKEEMHAAEVAYLEALMFEDEAKANFTQMVKESREYLDFREAQETSLDLATKYAERRIDYLVPPVITTITAKETK
jgi:hypothetical protein